jgi:dolichol-phosphate mannosyltransferase
LLVKDLRSGGTKSRPTNGKNANGRGVKQPLLSIVIPVYNERDTIQATLKRIRALKVDHEIIVVDDASTDGTPQLLAGEPGITLIRHAANEGKGAAIRSALGRVNGRIVAIQDADLEYDPSDLLRLIEPIRKSETRVVYGSRFLGRRPKMALPNYICNRLLALVTNLLYGARITDEATCYKVFDAELLCSLHLTCRRFEFCPEVTAKIRKQGERIVELPISYTPRSYDSGKKIRWWDGVEALWTLIRLRFGS